MDTKSLQYFVHVAESGSFSKASALLSITQPTLSRQIKRLEEALGVTLLHRDGRGISLTEAGRVLLGHAREIVDHLQGANADLAALRAEPHGEVTIAVPPTVSVLLLPPLMRELRLRYPKISLRVLQGLSGDINEWLVNGRIDAAILSQSPVTRQRAGEILVVEDLYLIGPAVPRESNESLEVQLSELSRYPLILPTTPHGLRTTVQATAEKHGVRLSVVLEIDALPMLVRAAQEGIGYSVLPYYAVANVVELGLVTARRVVNPTIQRTLLLATSHTKMLSPAARLLIDMIRRQVGALTHNKRWKDPGMDGKTAASCAGEAPRPSEVCKAPPRVAPKRKAGPAFRQ